MSFEGGYMKYILSASLALMLGLVLANTAFAAERVVLVEEMYQEG
jgi:hypothetical protein